ncbi:hypothetical protein KO500_05745 [Cellulophaga baltica]|uniref:hypothetical protein n=1 Tax=Cellulophaga TaxID=104264 RepID=UPI001C064FF8|nr:MULTISPECIES: hypothetical protein [Cellulophaga]MBU2995924.1 hypothetical protein [Cellulophaga baltica]MDO6767319.1 hypothetical protein [Cellulophaga sp. 1_MG-2023]
MVKKLSFSFVLLLVLSLFGCSLEDQENFQFVALPITAVTMPESFVLNETYEINVTYDRTSSCAFFEGFEVTKEADTIRNVVVAGSLLISSDDNCDEISDEVEATFNFIVLYNNTYVFKFLKGNNEAGKAEYIEIEVPVVE